MKFPFSFAKVLFALVLLVGSSRSEAALNAYAELRLNGTALTGSTTVSSIGGVNVASGHLECFAVNHEMFKSSTGGLAGSVATHSPFKLVKRMDRATPLLYKAFNENQTVTGKIKYFRENSEEGTTEHVFTIELLQGRVTGIRHWAPNNLDAAAFNYPQMEEVSIIYYTIRFRDEKTGTEYEMNAGER